HERVGALTWLGLHVGEDLLSRVEELRALLRPLDGVGLRHYLPLRLGSTTYRIVDKAYTIGNVTRTEIPGMLPDIERTVSALGAKVAAARAERGWSLAQLAQRSGLSPAAGHKIEKSGMTPTIASLMKIAAALGKSVSFFVDEPSTPDVSVVRADERAQVYTSKEGLDLKNISGRYGPFQIAGAEAVAEPYADSGPTPMNHPG